VIQDQQGNVFTSTSNICDTFETYLRQTYAQIASDSECTEQLIRVIRSADTPSYADHLEKSITADEHYAALRNGALNKVPGVDGLCLEFYTANWDTTGPDLLELINRMVLNKTISPQQKRDHRLSP
jgi:hypothetical protein